MITVIIAKYKPRDYELVQKTLPDAFPTLDMHNETVSQAMVELHKQGYEVEFEHCDAEGYFEFLKRNGAKHCRQNIAAYVNAKYCGCVDKDFSELKHLNITIVKE